MHDMFEMGLSGQMFDEDSVWEHLYAATDLGYHCVELRGVHVNPGTPAQERRAIRDYLSAHGLRVHGLSCFAGNYGLLSEKECEAAFETFRQYVELAEDLDAGLIRVWPGWQASAQAENAVWERAARWMRRSGEYSAAHGRRIVMEMHHGTLCDTTDSCLRLLGMIGCNAVGLTLDPVNLYQVPAAYTGDALRRLGGYIFNVHIKDIVRLETGEYEGAFPYSYYAGHIGRFTPVRCTAPENEPYFAHRRIGQGGVDWHGVLHGLREIGYDGPLVVESVREGSREMPGGYALAECCMRDAQVLQGVRPERLDWHRHSPDAPGLFHIVAPERGDTRTASARRLNLPAGETYTLETGGEEWDVLAVAGSASLSGTLTGRLRRLDSFYLPGGSRVTVTAHEPLTLYIGGAPCDGIGMPLFRRFDPTLPVGDRHQIHGTGSGAREVFFTLAPQDAASRLICGITFSGDGAWTSWPPHQHERDLEEIYCYFDISAPRAGLHLSYGTKEEFSAATAAFVRSGSMVMAPTGYHPTAAVPGGRNTYFWVLAAHSHAVRRYDLAVNDPAFDGASVAAEEERVKTI